MILWAVIVGAFTGWVLSEFSQFGMILGGLFGLGAGSWLRSEVRREIGRMIDARLGEAAPSAPVAAEAGQPSEVAAARPFEPPPPAPAEEPITQAWPEPPEEPRVTRELVPPGPREPSAGDRWIAAVREWLFGGNTIVRVGLVILFVGLTFLARYAVNAGLFPIEARLALVALAGLALIGVGLTRRIQRPAFALALQGTGVAVLYLTVFAAARLYELIPLAPAFVVMIAICALGCGLALMEDSLAMALTSFLGGYAVPLMLGGKSATPLLPFGYYTILNLAVLVIAGRRSWRPLNLLGFFATFGMATLWGMTSYEPQHNFICQVFLIASIVIYLATAVLYAHNTPGRFGNAADATLLFGPAIVGFGLEVGLVKHIEYGSAFAALAFGAGYLAVAAGAMRRAQAEMRLLNECLLAIGVGFVTLAIPLALDVKWTSSAWALEGAGAFWVGMRQARWMPRAFGLLLQLIAAAILLGTLGTTVSAIPFANTGFVGAALIAIPLLVTAWWLRQPLPHSGSSPARLYAPTEFGLRQTVFLAGFFFAVLAFIVEFDRRLPPVDAASWPQALFAGHEQLLLVMLAVLGLMLLGDWFGRHRDWLVATWPGRASLPLLAVCFIASLALDRHVLYRPDVLAWLLALGAHAALLRRQDRAGSQTYIVHAVGVWLLAGMLADCLQFGIERLQLRHTSWAGVILLVSVTAVLVGLTRWAGRAAGTQDTSSWRWPLDRHAQAYYWTAALPLALLTYSGAILTALFAAGVTDPLPYLPLINPVDLSVALALVTLALWRQMLIRANPPGAGVLLDNAAVGAAGILAFVAINGIWLRIAHHWLAVPYDASSLAQSPVVQTGLAILWTLMAMGLMLFAQRRAQRLPWLTGAGLLVVVVLKLVLVDMSKAEGWERIVTFIGVGILMLVIGYFVPLPPRQGGSAPEESRA